jgi:hypothetical protein
VLSHVSVKYKQGIVFAIRKHEELESISQPVNYIAKTELIPWRKKIDLVEPEAAEQIRHSCVFPYQHRSLWYICI